MINRRHVRETVLQALYALKQSGDSVQYITDSVIKDALGTEKEARRFAEKLFFRTLENEPELDEVIIKHIKNWEIQATNRPSYPSVASITVFGISCSSLR